jgi:hypothetical protein
MSADEVRNWRNQEPFEPFQIVTTSGDRYPVYQPTSVLITDTWMLVGTDYSSPQDFPESREKLSYEKITKVEPLVAAGRRRKK